MIGLEGGSGLTCGSLEAVEFHAPDLADGRHGGGMDVAVDLLIRRFDVNDHLQGAWTRVWVYLLDFMTLAARFLRLIWCYVYSSCVAQGLQAAI